MGCQRGRILRHGTCGRSRSLDSQMGVVTEEGGEGKTRAVISEILFYFLCLDFIDVYWLYILCIIRNYVFFFHFNSQEPFKAAEIHTSASTSAPHEVLAHPFKYPLAFCK